MCLVRTWAQVSSLTIRILSPENLDYLTLETGTCDSIDDRSVLPSSSSAPRFQSILEKVLVEAHLVSQASTYYPMADEEPVDQKKYLEESCKPKCVKPLLDYQACVKRIQGDETGQKHCTGQYFDYWSCVDKCVATKLFAKLK